MPQKGEGDRPRITAKEELCDRITRIMQDSWRRYLTRYPERARDDRNNDALEWSARGLGEILRAIREYRISFPPSGQVKVAEELGIVIDASPGPDTEEVAE